MHGEPPLYINEQGASLFELSTRRRLRFSTIGQLIIPQIQTEFGKKALVIVGLSAWNILPANAKLCISCFHASLKTFLFRVAYDNNYEFRGWSAGLGYW